MRLIFGLIGWVAAGVAFPEWSGAGEAPPAGSEGLVRFNNGDLLHGNVVSIDAQQQVRFSSPEVKEVMEFGVSDMTSMVFGPRRPMGGDQRPGYVVRFDNGDELAGNVSGLDKEKLVLDTWYAGSINVPRGKVRAIERLQIEEFIYEGPTGLEGWRVSDSAEDGPHDSWKYRDGVFFGKEGGGIARDMKLPDMASLDLEVAWRDFLQLTVTIYTKSLDVYKLSRNVQQAGGGLVNVPAPPQEGAGFYAIQLSRNTVYLLTVNKEGEVVNSPLDMIQGLERKTRAAIGLRINKAQKTITLLVDGNLVKTWKEEGEFAGQGTAVRFVQQGQALVNLSNIRVAKWDGRLSAPQAPVANLREDFVQLKNQDTLSGKLEGISDGKLSFTTSFGTLEIPVDRVSHIEMPVVVANQAVAPGSVRAHFSGRGMFTFRLNSWTDHRMVAMSPVFGEATFDEAAFERIEFNIEDKP